MNDEPSSPRRQRKHSTHAVLSDIADADRWWADTAQTPPAAQSAKVVRFRRMDPFERFWWVRYVVVTLSIMVPTLLVIKLNESKILRRFYDWKTDPVAQAWRCLESGRATEALAPLQFACEKKPNNPDLIRALAAVSMETSPAEARRCFHKLEQLNLATTKDRASHAILLAKLHDFSGAKAVLSRIKPGEQKQADVQRAWLAIRRESGDFSGAAEALNQIIAQQPDDVDSCLELATAAAAGGASQEITEQIQRHLLAGLSRWMNNGHADKVLDRASKLVALPFSGAACRAQAALILRNLPGQPAEYRVAAVRLGFPSEISASDEDGLQRAYQDEIVWSGGLSADEKDHVAAYFQRQNEHELVAELIAQPEALTEPQLYHRRLTSLVELGRWRDAGALAAASGAPRLTHSRSTLQALAVLQDPAGRTFMAERLLLDSLSSARDERRSPDCFVTGCAAMDHSLHNLASNAFAAALELSTDRKTVMNSILRVTRGRPMPVATLLRALEGSNALHDDSIQSQLIYLSLLAGHQVDMMADVIHARRIESPNDVYLRFLEAFALHQQSKFTQAAQILVPLPKYRWHQGEAAVIASIIAAAGNFDRSSALLGQIDSSLLFEEEKHLVEPWHQKLATDTLPMVSAAIGKTEL